MDHEAGFFRWFASVRPRARFSPGSGAARPARPHSGRAHDEFRPEQTDGTTLVVRISAGEGVRANPPHGTRRGEEERRGAARSLRGGATPSRSAAPRERPGIKRLSYTERREWDGMEAAIEAAEAALVASRGALDDPDVASDSAALAARYAAVEAARAQVDALYARWAELEGKQRGDEPREAD